MLSTGFQREVGSMVLKAATELPRALVTTKEAAAFLGLHPATIERACRRGYIPAELVDRRWLIRREDLLLATDPAVTPAVRPDLQTQTQKGTPRKRKPVIRSSQAKR
jgi:excisionase family DNA binding protein